MAHARFHLLPFISAAAIVTACGGNMSSGESNVSSIIDQNTMVVIDHSTPLNERAKKDLPAIGKMTGGCTAFHLGHGIVATAGHCFEKPKKSLAETSCHSTDIIWGQTLDTQTAERSRCLQILDYRFDDQADYALLQVDPAPSAAVEIKGDPREFSLSAQAMVIGYPKDKTLSWSGPCQASWASQSQTGSQFFQHRCDTLPGNSGSPVMDAQTSQVMGIHNGDADNQENYASFLPASSELIELGQKLDAPAATPKQLKYGPFGDQLNQDLVHFTKKQASFVSFDLSYDLEDGYDKLLVIDGLGRSHELTGAAQTHYEHIPTPLSLVVVTDYSGSSKAVALSSIRYE